MDAPDSTLGARPGRQSNAAEVVHAQLPFMVLGGLLGACVLKNSTIHLLGLVGLGAMLAVVVIGIVSCLRSPFPARLMATFLPLLAAYSLSIVLVPSAAAAKTYVQLVAVIIVFILGWRLGASPGFSIALRWMQLPLFAFAAVGVACAFLFRDAESHVFANPNTAGAAAFTGVVVSLMERTAVPNAARKRARNWVLLAFLVLVLASGARAALLGLISGAFVLLAWRVISRTRTKFWAVFAGLAVAIALGTWLLAQIGPGLELYEALHDASRAYTGKNVGTRTAVWSVVVPDIAARPVLGWGLGRQAGDNPYGNPDLSCHSQYLELGIKTGYMGIVALVASLASIWALFWRGRERREAQVAASLLLGACVHQMFEVNLLQIGLPLGISWWLLFGAGARACLSGSSSPLSGGRDRPGLALEAPTKVS